MAHLCLSAHAAAAQENVSVEVRLETPGTAQRFSRGSVPDKGERSTHPVLGGGIRVYGPEDRGALVDVQFLHDPDYDSILASGGTWRVHFLIAHLGFARRFRYPGRKEQRSVTITPHAAVALGRTRCQYCVRDREGVFGVRMGLDFDFHFRRGFVGFGARYELLFHRNREDLSVSHLIGFSFVPRFGFVLGRRVARTPESSPTRNGRLVP